VQTMNVTALVAAAIATDAAIRSGLSDDSAIRSLAARINNVSLGTSWPFGCPTAKLWYTPAETDELAASVGYSNTSLLTACSAPQDLACRTAVQLSNRGIADMAGMPWASERALYKADIGGDAAAERACLPIAWKGGAFLQPPSFSKRLIVQSGRSVRQALAQRLEYILSDLESTASQLNRIYCARDDGCRESGSGTFTVETPLNEQ